MIIYTLIWIVTRLRIYLRLLESIVIVDLGLEVMV